MLALSLFGHFHASLDGQPLPLPTKSAAALLAYLLLERGVPQPRPHLATLLWPDSTEAQGRSNLRQTLLRLHQALPDAAGGQTPVLAVHDTLQWNPAYPAQVDVYRFEAALQQAEPFLQTSMLETPYPALPHLQAAIELYPADLLTGFELLGDFYANWLLDWRGRYQRQALTALARLTVHYGRAGLLQRMENMARRQLALDPGREQAHGQLLQAYLAQGEYRTALTHYAAYEKQLNKDGLQPAPALQHWHELATAWRMGRASPPRPIPQNLPPETTPFYGRQQELDDLLLWLVAPDQRLLTLKGLGGIGKTRLALAAARHFLRSWPAISPRFPGGVWFVALAELQTDDEEVLSQAILQSCNWTTRPHEKSFGAVSRYLGADACLLLLDNLEHLPGMSNFVLKLLAAAPNLTILATSRRPVGLQQEVVRQLYGLPAPEDENDLAASSLALLRERIQRVNNAFQPTPAVAPALVRICHALDGWPLALELAASWANQLSPAEIAERVALNLTSLETSTPDLPARHRSVQAALVGSYTLLTPEQQRVLARFCVLRGGCTAEAAESMLAASAADLAWLTNHALLQKNGPRYGMHELIRQFGLTKLAQMGEQAAAERDHAAYYLNLLLSLRSDLNGAHPLTAISQLRAERSNIHKAWRWAWENGQYETLTTALPAISRFYAMTGLLQEWEALLRETIPPATQRPLAHDLRLAHANVLLRLGDYQAVLSLLSTLPPVASLPPSQQIEVQLCRGMLAILQGNMVESRQHYQQALELGRRLGQQKAIVVSLTQLGILSDYQESYEAELLALLPGVEDTLLLRSVYSFLGAVNIRHSRFRTTCAYWQKALAISLELDDPFASATFYNNLGDAWREMGEFAQAEQSFQRCMELAQSLHNEVTQMHTLEGWARLCVLQAQYARAIALAQDAIRLALVYDRPIIQKTALTCLGHAQVGLKDWAQAEAAYAAAVALAPEAPHLSLESLAGLAYVRWQQGDKAAARSYIERFLALLGSVSIEGCYSPALNYGRASEVLRGLGEEEKAAALLSRCSTPTGSA